MNTLKVTLLMGLLSVFLIIMGNLIGGPQGAMIFFLIALVMNAFGYFYSDKMAISMTGSRPLPEEEAPELHAMIRRLADNAGLPMPRVYLTPSPQPNAFATGRNPQNAAVAVTEGLLYMLDREELEGVIAHELAHIKNRDILISTIAGVFASAITMIANMLQWTAIFGSSDDEESPGGAVAALLMAFLAPIAATIIQLAISRSREYTADETGAMIAGRADGLVRALLKLDAAAHRIPMQVNPATSHFFIVNPLTAASIGRLFSTHPAIQDRVRRLQELRF